MNDRPPIRCAIYTRKSTEEGLEQTFNSLDAQREACESYILSQKAEGWIALADRYDDGGYSGGTLRRPALQQLLNNIESEKVDIVIVYKIDRLSRSLIDFAKLMDVFNRKSVTFVSITQSFSTVTSMGRLTLNVLLSFAQFEREVTGERIRDKFMASKKRGIWMGGNPPLGYDISNRRLVVNSAEAEIVRMIFQRYLDLRCVRLLHYNLKTQSVKSKSWISATGERRGDKPLGRSALYCILNNRTYLGLTVHKGVSYPGQHDAIVPSELFEAVQRRLASLRPPRYGKGRLSQHTSLSGIVFDETGMAMLPTYTVKRGGRRYRYYVSRSSLRGEHTKAAIYRIPASSLESYVSSVMKRFGLPERGIGADPLSALVRIDINSDRISLIINRAAARTSWLEDAPQGGGRQDQDMVRYFRSFLTADERLSEDSELLTLILPMWTSLRGRHLRLPHLPGAVNASQLDVALVKAIARAHRWKQMLLEGKVMSIKALAGQVRQERCRVGQMLKLAFLSPEQTRAILYGRQPAGLRLVHLLETDIPLSWQEHAAVIARASNALKSRTEINGPPPISVHTCAPLTVACPL